MTQGDLEKERHDMKRRINSLSDKLTTVEEEKRIERLVHQQKEAGLSSTVPERFLNKMKVNCLVCCFALMMPVIVI